MRKIKLHGVDHPRLRYLTLEASLRNVTQLVERVLLAARFQPGARAKHFFKNCNTCFGLRKLLIYALVNNSALEGMRSNTCGVGSTLRGAGVASINAPKLHTADSVHDGMMDLGQQRETSRRHTLHIIESSITYAPQRPAQVQWSRMDTRGEDA